jgi:hypothetical protein
LFYKSKEKEIKDDKINKSKPILKTESSLKIQLIEG